MKIIFSRKGFDSSAGGYPSLIFPDDSLFSIPIPSSKDEILYSDLTINYEGESIQSILNDITGNKICNNGCWRTCDFTAQEQRCHYDPMPIEEETCFAFGQTGASESHLRGQGVDKGDIFIFYGWFKQIEKIDGQWRYKAGAKDIHLAWAWMRVGEVICLDTLEQRQLANMQYPFLAQHPHLAEWRKSPNQIYLSDEAGLLPYSEQQCLTDCANYQGRSTWRLPSYFNQPNAFTYLKNFAQCGEQVIIKAPGRGQEFVLDLERVEKSMERGQILNWINDMTEPAMVKTKKLGG